MSRRDDVMTDDDGKAVKAGDWISFCYGIAPVRVDAVLRDVDGKMILTCLGRHKPRQAPLSTLRKHVGSWYKTDGPRPANAALDAATDRGAEE